MLGIFIEHLTTIIIGVVIGFFMGMLLTTEAVQAYTVPIHQEEIEQAEELCIPNEGLYSLKSFGSQVEVQCVNDGIFMLDKTIEKNL